MMQVEIKLFSACKSLYSLMNLIKNKTLRTQQLGSDDLQALLDDDPSQSMLELAQNLLISQHRIDSKTEKIAST